MTQRVRCSGHRCGAAEAGTDTDPTIPSPQTPVGDSSGKAKTGAEADQRQQGGGGGNEVSYLRKKVV